MKRGSAKYRILPVLYPVSRPQLLQLSFTRDSGCYVQKRY
jgi:hypothetical protein